MLENYCIICTVTSLLDFMFLKLVELMASGVLVNLVI